MNDEVLVNSIKLNSWSNLSQHSFMHLLNIYQLPTSKNIFNNFVYVCVFGKCE